MNDELSTLRTQCVESLQNSADYVMKYLDGEEQKKEINKLKTYVQSYCYLDQLADLEEVKDFIDEQSDEICNYEEFETKLSALGKNLNHSNHTYMKSFMDKIKSRQASQSESEDCEIEITDVMNTRLDPITKKPIKIPVHNKICGHWYDMTSISNYIRMKRNAKCPYSGCGNTTPIAVKHLISTNTSNEDQRSQEYEDSDDSMDYD